MLNRSILYQVESFWKKMEVCTILQSNFIGYINTNADATVVIEACLRGYLRHLPRRLSNTERDRLITSGSVFVYETECSGITTWDDCMRWGRAQEHSGFQIYRSIADTTSRNEKSHVLYKKTTFVTIGRCVHYLVAYYDECNIYLMKSPTSSLLETAFNGVTLTQ